MSLDYQSKLRFMEEEFERKKELLKEEEVRRQHLETVWLGTRQLEALIDDGSPAAIKRAKGIIREMVRHSTGPWSRRGYLNDEGCEV